ncbi:MAG: hypothetical protein G01um10142_393 [Parcubacteria group bacterium Gr01-1014_2]|nr:MAG: hypothetical protein G01um10142_393 [Parcubacteria group bacterium Gr01-1014_2]
MADFFDLSRPLGNDFKEDSKLSCAGSVRRADSEAVLAWFPRSGTKRPMTSEGAAGAPENERTGYSPCSESVS